MNDFTYHVPTKFVFGRGSVDEGPMDGSFFAP